MVSVFNIGSTVWPQWLISCLFYSVELSKLKNCIAEVMKNCAGDLMTESQIRDIIDKTVTEEQQCLDGSMEIPTMPPSGSICSASFSSNAETCVRSFHQMFAKDKSDPALCS